MLVPRLPESVAGGTIRPMRVTAADRPDFTLERRAMARGLSPVCGIDEAGRGPLAGPVVAACVVLDPAAIPAGLADSKKLSAAARARLLAELQEVAAIGIGQASAAEIDRLNIHHATLLAMARAFAALPGPAPLYAYVDGKFAPDLPCRADAVVKGDAKVLSIAAASIVAKVTRDRLMEELDAMHPGYGFASHKGYPVAAHRAALVRLGPCAAHRKSYAPVRAVLPR